MLKPFQIRDLYEEPTASFVQLSSSDYDHIASNHPRARLSYNDDDGDRITVNSLAISYSNQLLTSLLQVGSSFELGQRLDEIPEGPYDTMHIFDIRRSNSVSELWKRFKYESPAPEESSRPLMAEFEAELARILQSTSENEPPERAPQPEPSPTDTEFTPNFRSLFGVAEGLATSILNQLTNEANMAHYELRTRLPELRRHVQSAQRQVPENIGARLQNILANVENQLMFTMNNLPNNRSQWVNSGRQLAEEAIQVGRPLAETAARALSSELNQVGRTLFSAFESEVGRSVPQRPNMTPSDRPSVFYDLDGTNVSRENRHTDKEEDDDDEDDGMQGWAPSFSGCLLTSDTTFSPTSDRHEVQPTFRNTLFIGNVSFNVSSKNIQRLFALKGFVVDTYFPVDRVTGKHAGFGYLLFPSFPDALQAQLRMHGFILDGFTIILDCWEPSNAKLKRQGRRPGQLSHEEVGVPRGMRKFPPVTQADAYQLLVEMLRQEVPSSSSTAEEGSSRVEDRANEVPVPDVVRPDPRHARVYNPVYEPPFPPCWGIFGDPMTQSLQYDLNRRRQPLAPSQFPPLPYRAGQIYQEWDNEAFQKWVDFSRRVQEKGIQQPSDSTAWEFWNGMEREADNRERLQRELAWRMPRSVPDPS